MLQNDMRFMKDDSTLFGSQTLATKLANHSDQIITTVPVNQLKRRKLDQNLTQNEHHILNIIFRDFFTHYKKKVMQFKTLKIKPLLVMISFMR
jgi:hypothetical protein